MENALAKKLGVKPGHKMLVMNAPEGYLETLGDLPQGAEVRTSANVDFDFVQVFVYKKWRQERLPGQNLLLL